MEQELTFSVKIRTTAPKDRAIKQSGRTIAKALWLQFGDNVVVTRGKTTYQWSPKDHDDSPGGE